MVPQQRRLTGSQEALDYNTKWIKILGAVVALLGSFFVVGSWIYSRASIRDVEIARKDLQQAIDLKPCLGDMKRIEHRMDKTEEIILNVRDNVLILMDRQRIKPKPMNGVNDDE